MTHSRPRLSIRAIQSLVAALALAAAAGCGSSSGPLDAPLSGRWLALCGIDVACELRLQQHGVLVTGQHGSVANTREFLTGAVTGDYVSPNVHLQWTDGGQQTTFDGVVQGDTAMVGTLRTNTSVSMTFHRSD